MSVLHNIQIKGQFPLFKIQRSDLIDSLQSGCFYMNSLKYYRELYNTTLDETIGDPHEGKLVINNGALHISGSSTPIPLNGYPLATKNENDFVLCMFGINTLLHNKFTLNNEQKEKLKGFGDSVLVFTDIDELIIRIANAAKKANVKINGNFVNYYSEDIDIADRFIPLVQNGIENIVFHKRERYSYQQEYRFTVENPSDEDKMILDIGDITSISEKITLEEFLNSELVARV